MKLRKQVLFALVLLTASSAWAQQLFSGGSGTSNAPYQISSTEDLDQLATNVNSGTSYSGTYFELTQDITYNTSTDAWNDATSTVNNFTAIGTESRPFAGIFNGQNHTISGIRIYSNSNSYQGLFGNNSGTVRNVTIANTRITGNSYLGGIAGNNTGTIENCRVMNDVMIHTAATSGIDYLGGIAGKSLNGTISHCVSSVQITEVSGVTTSYHYGGITGYGQGLSNNIAYGVNISANNLNHKAAIVGERSVDNLTYNYYINCSLISTDPNNSFTITSDIGRAYQTGGNNHEDVTTNDGAVAVWAVTLADNFISVATSATAVTFNGTNYYKKWATFTLSHVDRAAQGYVFSNYSVTKDGTNPVQNVTVNESAGVFSFDMPGNNVTVKAIYNIQWTGSGEQEDPYIILDTNHLNYLATRVNSGQDYSGKHFKLGADITYRHSTDWDDNNSTENNYVSIGTDNHKFRGNFDGDNHTISGIRIYKNDLGVGGDFDNNGGRIGIFGYINDATIENIILTDCRYTGYNDVGGIVGQMQGGTVSHCHVLSDVVIYSLFNSASGHGGVVGTCNYGAGGIVEYCSSSAKVISSVVNNDGSDFGGLVGSGGGYVRNNLVIGATVDSACHWYGAISGDYENQEYYSNNYYRECTVAGLANARSRGTRGVNIAGTQPCFLITCGENISTNAMTFTIPAHGNVPATTYVFSTDQSWVQVNYNVQHDANREAVLTVSRFNDEGNVYRTDDVTEGGSFQILYSDVSIALKGLNLLKTIEPNKWYAISSPLHDNGQTYESISNVNNLASGTYDMFRYNESTMTWENRKAAAGFSTLEAGRGYIYRFGGNDNVTLHYSGIDNAGAVQYEVTNTNSVPQGMRGFNLIGNPYPHQIYYGTAIPTTNLADNYYYSLDPNGCWHIRTSSEPIGIGEAVLVMADQTHTINFSDVTNPPAKNYCNSLKFTVSDGVDEDVAYAVMETSFEEKTGLPKIAHLDNELPSLSINMKNSNYAMAAIDAETSELPLHFNGKTGKYTISVEAVENADYLHLIDLQTGNDIDLLSNPTYNFTQSGNNTSAQGARFLVKFSNSQLPTSNSLFAYQSGDQTIITGTGALQVFDVMGRQLLSTDVDSSPFSLHRSQFPATGVYILRLDGQTQKIVIR